jgi:hypothetical protein
MSTQQRTFDPVTEMDWRMFKSSLRAMFSQAFYVADLEMLYLVATQDGYWWIGGWRDEAHVHRVIDAEYRHLINIARSSSQNRVTALLPTMEDFDA